MQPLLFSTFFSDIVLNNYRQCDILSNRGQPFSLSHYKDEGRRTALACVFGTFLPLYRLSSHSMTLCYRRFDSYLCFCRAKWFWYFGNSTHNRFSTICPQGRRIWDSEMTVYLTVQPKSPYPRQGDPLPFWVWRSSRQYPKSPVDLRIPPFSDPCHTDLF